MIKNYIQVAFRNLIRNKSYVLINTFGLGISLACCITAYLILAFNIEFDDFHKNEKVENVYKIHTHFKEKDDNIVQSITAPMVLPTFAVPEMSGIESYTRYINGSGHMLYEDNVFSEGIAFADSTFFEMFDFPLVKGSHESFKNKHSVFIDQKTAKKYFGDDDPIGKIISLTFPNDYKVDAIVSGVLAKIPLNNTFVFGVMMRIEHYIDMYKLGLDNWGDWRDPSTFVKLNAHTDIATINKHFDKYIPTRNEAKKDVVAESYHLEPFKSSFTEDDVRDRNVNIRISIIPLILFTSLAILILLIACFNLTNTSIALTAKRLKEVGVRKVVGAARGQIVTQFLLETAIIITLALFVGLILSQFIVPAFTTMWRIEYGLEDLNGVNLFITLVTLIFAASLIAGMYPALFNSRFKPVVLLKGTVKIKGTNALTRTLVALQFALSVIVLVAGVEFIRNAAFQQSIKFGYDKEKIITINIQSHQEYEAFKNAITSNPDILSVAVSDHQVGYSSYEFPVHIDTTEYRARLIGVGENYFETMGFVFAEGRPMNLRNSSDAEEAIVVNEAFLEKVGITGDPLDKIVTVHDRKRHIVGVLENHVDNLFRSKEAEPFAFYPAQESELKLMFVRAEPSHLGSIQKYLEKTWKEIYPNKPFLAQFQEDIVMAQTNETNGNLEKIFLFLTVLGGMLSVSGIFALASLNIAKRTKEIGIRKALGASVPNVVALLNKEFVIILGIAVTLGATAGFVLTTGLLDEIYTQHIEVGILSVTLCALMIFTVGIMTTSTTIFKAAKANPVDTLRNE